MMITLMPLIVLSFPLCSLLSVPVLVHNLEVPSIKCTSHIECLDISNKSFCQSNVCSCENGYKFNVQRGCTRSFTLLEACDFSENCSDAIKNSYCSSRSVCECLPNYRISDDNKFCLKRGLSEMKCASDQECHEIVRNTHCNSYNSCLCESDFYDESECYLSNPNISKCHDSVDCHPMLNDSQCIDGICMCPDGFIQVNNSFCQPQVSEDCFDNATCHASDLFSFCSAKNSCECLSGYYLSDMNKCLKRNLGNACLLDSDCEDAIKNAVCNHEICECKLGYREGSERSCVQIQIGDSCNEDEECNTSIKNSYCHRNLLSCHCNSGFVENDFSLFCNKLKIGSGECKNETECLDAIPNSYCNEDMVCHCVSGYAVSGNLDDCTRRKLGDRNCMVRSDCSDSISNGNCSVDGQCICDVGHYPDTSDSYLCTRRILGDSCSTDLDCSSVISNSLCLNYSCNCMLGFIGEDDAGRCRPRILRDNCSVDEDCATAIHSSFCQENMCTCLSGFAEMDNSTCQKRKIGDRNCEVDSDCYDAVMDSQCQIVLIKRLHELDEQENSTDEYDEVKTCLCRLGFYDQNNGTTCTLRQIGDDCSTDDDCSHAVDFSICNEKALNCTCDYDHMVEPPNMSKCVDRPIIDQYKPDKVLRIFRKTYGCGRVFQYHKHTQQCPMAISCEGGKMRDIYGKQPHCQRSNAYILTFNCTLIVGKYEHVPLKYNTSFMYNKTSDFYWENALRLSFYGVDQIILGRNSSFSKPAFLALASRYLSGRVLHFEPMREGIQAIVAIFFKLDKNSSEADMETINSMVLQHLDGSKGEIGLSKIFITEPYNENFLVEDYDECETNSSFPAVVDSNLERNDCNQNAICVNFQGFYRCVCDTSFVDQSEDKEFDGRTCTYKSDTLEFELLLSQKECTEENKCETPWSFVIFVTTIIFGLLFLLLAFETVWRMKQMSRSLDEKCRRQTAQLEMKLSLLREERRRNINRLLGRPETIDIDNNNIDHNHHDEITQTESSL